MNSILNIGVLSAYTEGFYFGNILEKIHYALREKGIQMYIYNTWLLMKNVGSNESDLKYFQLTTKQIDGWIALHRGASDKHIEIIHASGKPITFLSWKSHIKDIPAVLDDGFQSEMNAVEHLIEHGHKRIAFVGDMNVYDMQKRYEGYVAALKKHTIPYDETLFFNSPNCMQVDGIAIGKKIIDKGVPCTAIVAANDYLGLGIIESLINSGYKVPEDVAVIGYDDIEICSEYSPSITSVRQDIEALGKEAVRVTCAHILKEKLDQNLFFVSGKLMKRETCGCEAPDRAEYINTNISSKKVIDYLENIMIKNHQIGNRLMESNIDEIKVLVKLIPSDSKSMCLALWDKTDRTNNTLCIQHMEDTNEDVYSWQGTQFTPENFPIINFKNENLKLEENDIVWIYPLKSQTRDFGVYTYISPINKFSLHCNFNNSLYIYDMVSFALDKEKMTEEVHIKDNRYQNLLDNVGQGFLTVGDELNIDPEHSAACRTIFGKDITGMNLPELIFSRDLEKKDYVTQILSDVHNEKDLNKLKIFLRLLPEEIMINDRNIEVEYKVISEIDHSKKIMLVLTDVTKRKNLEYDFEKERQLVKMVVKVVANFNDFNQIINDYRNFCENALYELFDRTDSTERVSAEIYRNIHTYKGVFGQMEMSGTVMKLHAFEDHISKKRITHTYDAFKDFILSQDLMSWIEDDMALLRKSLGEKYFIAESMMILDERKLKEIEDKIIENLSPFECRNLLSLFRKLRYRSFKDLLKSYSEYVEKMAQRTGKMVYTFETEGKDFWVDTDKYFGFTKTLVNLFRNAVDHGIEFPDERLTLGKDEYGSIKCSILLSDKEIIVAVSDDGNGIDLATIVGITLEKGIYSSQEINSMNEEDKLNLIFLDEMTTKSQVTEFSGRGEGLAAVKYEVDKLDGKIKIENRPGQGVTFQFYLPYEKEFETDVSTVQNVLDSIIKTAKEYFTKNFGFHISSLENFQPLEKPNVSLYKISSFIEFKGILHGWIVLSADAGLARVMVQQFMYEKLSKEEEEEYMVDVLAECTNTVLGNSINYYKYIRDLIEIGVPTTMNLSNSGTIRYPMSDVWEGKLAFEDGELSISFVLSKS